MSEDLRQKDGDPEPDAYKQRDDDTEAHRQSTINGRDGSGPEGATRKQTLIDTDDDVEGHKRKVL
jgi:hypothetical protein